jgi:uncharacterized protein YcaQ
VGTHPGVLPREPQRLTDLSLREARAIALRAQGFIDAKPAGRVDLRHLRRVFGRVKLIQIDSVNVLVRSHYFPAFSRLGVYPARLLDQMAYERRELFEYWGHEASFIPVELYPLMRWRMDAARRGELWQGIGRFARENTRYAEEIYEQVRERGPISASKLKEAGQDPRGRRSGQWWGWAPGKTALEWLFWTGRITASHRRNFERVYDLIERVIPEEYVHAPVPEQEDAHRELLAIGAQALGIATVNDIADYFRIKKPDARARIAELADAGRLVPVTVEGWKQPAYMDPSAKVPRKGGARALVSPFDSLVWERARTHRLFGFHYRIEIYTPAHKRVHGYYVVPFLLSDHLVARVDLKADRKAGSLLVHAAYAEEGEDPKAVAGPLAEELARLAEWLELDRIRVARRGNLARALKGAARA